MRTAECDLSVGGTIRRHNDAPALTDSLFTDYYNQQQHEYPPKQFESTPANSYGRGMPPVAQSMPPLPQNYGIGGPQWVNRIVLFVYFKPL